MPRFLEAPSLEDKHGGVLGIAPKSAAIGLKA